jgi:hypothetical protein
MHDAIPAILVGDDVESKFNRKERRERIRKFVRFVVAEYKLLKAMGMDDAISLYRISFACTKAEAAKARERAANGQESAKSSCCSTLLRQRHCSRKHVEKSHTVTNAAS